MTLDDFGAGPLSARFDDALLFASEAHRMQTRKIGRVPYLSHVLRVSGLVLDYGASEDVAIAAILHDVVEDCGGLAMSKKVRDRFGERVAGLVLETTDSTAEDSSKKAPWRERKEAFINRLSSCSPEGALIIGCDKLDNVTSLTRAVVALDCQSVFSKFKGGRSGEFWYWDSIVSILSQRMIPVASELSVAVERLCKIWIL